MDREAWQDRSFLKYVLKEQCIGIEAIPERKVSMCPLRLEQIMGVQRQVTYYTWCFQNLMFFLNY